MPLLHPAENTVYERGHVAEAISCEEPIAVAGHVGVHRASAFVLVEASPSIRHDGK